MVLFAFATFCYSNKTWENGSNEVVLNLFLNSKRVLYKLSKMMEAIFGNECIGITQIKELVKMVQRWWQYVDGDSRSRQHWTSE